MTVWLGDELGALLGDHAAAADRDLVRRTVQLLFREREAGHVCVRLADWQDRAPDDGAPPFPAAATWTERLLASGICDAGDRPRAPRPLVLDGDGRLYFLRHFRDERAVLAHLQARLAGPPRVAPARLRAVLQELGMLPPAGTVDWQVAAVAAAVQRSFVVLTGGPGTGKTTTVARLLAVLLRLEPGLTIALCAPTGKAAARLGEALHARAKDQPHLAAALPSIQTRTLHRLLGYLPLDDEFRFGEHRQLPHDVVVVDEASMLDPALLAQLGAALRPAARLVLVGDRDQLAAVAAGQVLGDLCRAARPERGVGPALAACVQQATGMALPVQPHPPPIADAVVALRENHRFASQPGIGGFAQALAARDVAAALTVLAAGHDDLVSEPDADAALQSLAPALLAAAAAATPPEALQHLWRCRVLCATRHGPMGAIAWNRRIEALLRQHGHRSDEPFYRGRPILVTVNDHQNRIWNGDLGVVVEHDDRRFVAFETEGGWREVSLLRLPAHETAWAMTVHKAQGSEFDQVLLAMPDMPGPLWQAPLLYTGITRARRRAVLCADPTLLRAGLGNWPPRSSGLAAALAARGEADGS
ncbi:MAG: exodeoxyribonuclease V subunit alpha [Planctomycetes bacterium]|nr:exodeoxyribonuclease V subunit alpha [Planctomycetota bacterium]